MLNALLAGRDAEAAAARGLPPAHKPIKYWIQKQLPLHEAEARKNEDEDEDAGVNDSDYECKVCKVAFSEEDEYLAEHLRDFFSIYKRMKSYPKSVRYEKMARKWNSTLYEMDVRVNRRLRIPNMTRADVRYHMVHHYKPTDIERLDDMQSYVYENMRALQDEGLWRQECIDGVPQPGIGIDPTSNASWCKLNNQYVKLGKLKNTALSQEIKSKNPNAMNTGSFITAKIRKETQL